MVSGGPSFFSQNSVSSLTQTIQAIDSCSASRVIARFYITYLSIYIGSYTDNYTSQPSVSVSVSVYDLTFQIHSHCLYLNGIWVWRTWFYLTQVTVDLLGHYLFQQSSPGERSKWMDIEYIFILVPGRVFAILHLCQDYRNSQHLV